MENCNIEHEQINSTKRHLQRAWWIISILEAVSALIGYIIIAVAFQRVIDVCKMEGLPTSDLAGYCALIFFVMLFGSALFIYLVYILKEFLQIKLCYFGDVKYIRQEIKAINTSKQGVVRSKTINSNGLCTLTNVEYRLWSNVCLAYVVAVADNDGAQITFSRDKNKALTFKSKESASEYATIHNLDAIKDFAIV